MRPPYWLPIVAALAGCAAPETPLPGTESGLVTATFAGQTVERMAGRLATWCAETGLIVRTGAPGALSCGKSAWDEPGGELRAALIQNVVGNPYSTPVELRLVFSIWPAADGATVQVRAVYETQMPGGQVNQVPVSNPRLNNELLKMFRRSGAG